MQLEMSEKDELKHCSFRWVSGFLTDEHRVRHEAFRCQLF